MAFSLKSWFGPKTKLFEHTERGKMLGRIAEEGAYSPEMTRSMIGRSTAQNQAIAQKRQADIKGGLISSGMEGSIAGQRLMASPGVQTQRNISDVASNINMANEQSKLGAEEQLATGKDISRQTRRAERQNLKSNILKGIGTGAGLFFGGPLGASIGGKIGGAVAGEPMDVAGIANDIYTNRLADLKEQEVGLGMETEQARKAYYERGNKEPKAPQIPNNLSGMTNQDLLNLSYELGIDFDDLLLAQSEQEVYGENNMSGVPLRSDYMPYPSIGNWGRGQ